MSKTTSTGTIFSISYEVPDSLGEFQYEVLDFNEVTNQDAVDGNKVENLKDSKAGPLWCWINVKHDGNITHAAKALGVDRSTLYRVMDTAYVINGKLYTIKRKAL